MGYCNHSREEVEKGKGREGGKESGKVGEGDKGNDEGKVGEWEKWGNG